MSTPITWPKTSSCFCDRSAPELRPKAQVINGQVLNTEPRDVQDIKRIALSGIGNLIIEPGDQEALIVEADPELLANIITEVRDGTLVLQLKPPDFISWFKRRNLGPINYYLTVKEIDALDVSGAGKIEGSNLITERMKLSVSGAGKIKLGLQVDHLRTKISGAGKVQLAGKADDQRLSISGAGKYTAQELSSKECKVSISGAGKAQVNASEKLQVRISGAGKVAYLGAPTLSKSISGAGSVRHV